MMSKSYSELIQLPTFKERLRYLQLSGIVGADTFGSKRWANQAFYHSREWRDFRNQIIIRDEGNDLAVDGYPIVEGIVIHHLNPISIDDILNRSKALLDPENAVCVSPNTHRAIHYGYLTDEIASGAEGRQPNDTCPWRKK